MLRRGVHCLMEMPRLIYYSPLSFVMNVQDCEEGRILHQVQPDGAPPDVWWETRGEPALLLCTSNRREAEWFGIISVPPTRELSPMAHPHIVGAESVSDPFVRKGLIRICVHKHMFLFPRCYAKSRGPRKSQCIACQFPKNDLEDWL